MHVHWGRVKHQYAQWLLKECRCGARISLNLYRCSGYSSLEYGWPGPDESWVEKPANGWPEEDFWQKHIPKPPPGPGSASRAWPQGVPYPVSPEHPPADYDG